MAHYNKEWRLGYCGSLILLIVTQPLSYNSRWSQPCAQLLFNIAIDEGMPWSLLLPSWKKNAVRGHHVEGAGMNTLNTPIDDLRWRKIFTTCNSIWFREFNLIATLENLGIFFQPTVSLGIAVLRYWPVDFFFTGWCVHKLRDVKILLLFNSFSLQWAMYVSEFTWCEMNMRLIPKGQESRGHCYRRRPSPLGK